MRRVAQELNDGTMSLYYYVKTKDDLVAVMDDALMSVALLESVPKNWKRAITEISTRTHSMFLIAATPLAARPRTDQARSRYLPNADDPKEQEPFEVAGHYPSCN